MKNYIGLDIGTTSVSAVRVENGAVEKSVTLAGAPFLDESARTQNADVAVEIALSALNRLQNEDTVAIGVTGQMHGIVYVDQTGNAVSPLYTWQNPYGNQPFSESETVAQRLSALCGYPMASGYGITTLFYHTARGEVPKSAAKICTVHDYLAMKLTGNAAPVLHPSDAASFGAFDLTARAFDRAALEKTGIPLSLLPEVSSDGFVGKTTNGVPVTLAVGDNQAAVFGALRKPGVSVNVGTGSQVSVVLSALPDSPDFEVRPFLFGKYLGVECPLCGGRSYALLADFFRKTLAAFGKEEDDVYDVMNDLAKQGELLFETGKPTPVFDPLFCGTRKDPSARASLTDLTAENFTPASVAYALVFGMAEELHRGYRKISGKDQADFLAASGNGVRKTPVLARALHKKFGVAPTLPEGKEEAAFGAALYAACLNGEKL